MANGRPTYLSVSEFKNLLVQRPLEEVVKTYVFGGVPFVFANQPSAMDTLKQHLHDCLGVAAENIKVIGSAKIGFSLSPDNFPRNFTRRSDIDVLLVDDAIFDMVWKTLLAWHYPRRFVLDGVDWDWVKRRRDEVYWGWLDPSKIHYTGLSLPASLVPMRDLSAKWFGAFRSLKADIGSL